MTLMPRCCMRRSRRALSSGKGTAGLATSDVSSRNNVVGEKGIAYRNVGSACADAKSRASCRLHAHLKRSHAHVTS